MPPRRRARWGRARAWEARRTARTPRWCRRRRHGHPCRKCLRFEGTLDERDVHPAVELVGGILNRSDHLEAVSRVQREPGAIVGRDRGDDRAIAQALRFLDQLG